MKIDGSTILTYYVITLSLYWYSIQLSYSTKMMRTRIKIN